MSFATDDLAPLLVPASDGRGLGFGQGIIREYDPLTAANKVEYRGVILTDLPLLNSSEALLLTPGAVVGILSWRTSYFILGRITVPNTPEAATALNMVRIHSASVSVNDSITSTTFADAPTPGPTVTGVLVSKSGRLLLFVSAWMRVVTNGGIDTAGVDMAPDITGATTIAPSLDTSLKFLLSTTQSTADIIAGRVRATATAVIEGLNPGLHSITAKYRTTFSGHTTEVDARNLTVMPF